MLLNKKNSLNLRKNRGKSRFYFRDKNSSYLYLWKIKTLVTLHYLIAALKL